MFCLPLTSPQFFIFLFVFVKLIYFMDIPFINGYFYVFTIFFFLNNIYSVQALAWAAYFGRGQVIRVLLEKGANFKKTNNMGQLPADIAYDHGYTEVNKL